MKVRLLVDCGICKVGDEVEAKRYKDMTEQEIADSTLMPDNWDGNEIFVSDDGSTELSYMYDNEVEIIEE